MNDFQPTGTGETSRILREGDKIFFVPQPKEGTPEGLLFRACVHRDETRRWLMDIGDELGVEVPEPVDGMSPHESWRRYKDAIMEHVKSGKAVAP